MNDEEIIKVVDSLLARDDFIEKVSRAIVDRVREDHRKRWEAEIAWWSDTHSKTDADKDLSPSMKQMMKRACLEKIMELRSSEAMDDGLYIMRLAEAVRTEMGGAREKKPE